MADKFSAQWWNDQAGSSGLSKSAIESLTGMTFQTKWNPDGTIAYFWYIDVRDRAPGFADAHLLLSPGTGQGTQDVTANIGNPNWGDWAVYVSAVGNIAPGATDAWNPVLNEQYSPAPAPAPTEPNPTDGSLSDPVTVPNATAPPTGDGTVTFGTDTPAKGGSQTFTGGEVQPGGGGDISPSAGPTAAIAEGPAPGSQYVAVNQRTATDPAAASVPGVTDRRTWYVVGGLVVLVLVVAFLATRKRSG